MRRQFIIAIALALVMVPVTTMAHAPTGTDTNTLVLDDVWSIFGPGCNVDDTTVCDVDRQAEEATLDALGLSATPFGGGLSGSTVHAPPTGEEDSHGTETHTLTGYQCNGLDPIDGEEFDAQLQTEFPFFHSDLENGIFEATGSFFVPFEVTGSDADKVEQLWFGYAHTFPWPASSGLCQGAFPLTGAYYEFYRGDTEGADGWEIPINTLLVPDMAYGAIVRGQDAAGNTVVAGFVYANVNNYLNELNWRPGGTPQDCADETGGIECNYHDLTPPFPTVKGARPVAVDVPVHAEDSRCSGGILFSFGEPLAGTPTFVDGDVRDSWTMDEAEPRDVDPFPITTVDKQGWGPEYCVDEVSQESDTVTVIAEDLQGNTAIRAVTHASPSS